MRRHHTQSKDAVAEADDGSFDGVVPVPQYQLPLSTSERPSTHVIEQARGKNRLAESDPAHRKVYDALWRVAKVAGIWSTLMLTCRSAENSRERTLQKTPLP